MQLYLNMIVNQDKFIFIKKIDFLFTYTILSINYQIKNEQE